MFLESDSSLAQAFTVFVALVHDFILSQTGRDVKQKTGKVVKKILEKYGRVGRRHEIPLGGIRHGKKDDFQVICPNWA